MFFDAIGLFCSLAVCFPTGLTWTGNAIPPCGSAYLGSRGLWDQRGETCKYSSASERSNALELAREGRWRSLLLPDIGKDVSEWKELRILDQRITLMRKLIS